jgi:para-nitrobenzyl esterase
MGLLFSVALPCIIGIAWSNRAMAQVPAVDANRAGSSDPIVSVTGGQVRGRLLPQESVAVFKGIPYAAPPVGDLRWREPQPVKPWQGVRDANAFSASCVQSNQNVVSKEDCLYLNVWAPGWPSNAKRPVLFWIHGGANVSGSASLPLYDGAALSRRGIVVVSINYRLGVLGFLAHPELTAESTHHVSGNYTLLDMVAALKWVHENIARFGGDPDNVTVGGQSSSGHDIAHLLFSPLTNGLFQRAIQESGVGSIPRPTLHKAEQQGTRFAASLKAPPGASQIKFLRGLPADVLQKAATSASSGDAPTVAPNVDGWFMPVSNGIAFAEGREQHIPLLIGSNSTEHPDMGALSLIAEAAPQLTGSLASEPTSAELHDVRVAVVAAFGMNADKAMAYYGLANGGTGKTDPLFSTVTAQVSADIRYRCPVLTEATFHTSRNDPVYEYQFDRALPGQPLTAHAAELAFVFGNLLQGRLTQPFTDEDRKLSDVVQTYWTNFIKSGNPNGAGLPAWQRFDAAERSYLEFTTDGKPVAKSGLRREICDLFIENVRHEMKLP